METAAERNLKLNKNIKFEKSHFHRWSSPRRQMNNERAA